MIANTKAYTFASRTSPDTNQSLQKSMLSPPLRKNKKSPPLKKDKTLPTHHPPDKNGMSDTVNKLKGMSLERKEGQLVINRTLSGLQDLARSLC